MLSLELFLRYLIVVAQVLAVGYIDREFDGVKEIIQANAQELDVEAYE